MGRNGALLRQQKAQRVTYTFTKEQLAEHDKQVQNAYRDRCMDLLKQRQYEHEQLFLFDQMQYVLSAMALVLVRDFKYCPINGWRNNRLARVVDAVMREVAQEDMGKDAYMKKAGEITGVMFEVDEDD